MYRWYLWIIDGTKRRLINVTWNQIYAPVTVNLATKSSWLTSLSDNLYHASVTRRHTTTDPFYHMRALIYILSKIITLVSGLVVSCCKILQSRLVILKSTSVPVSDHPFPAFDPLFAAILCHFQFLNTSIGVNEL